MDPLALLLDGPRARSAFVLRSSLTAPWAIRIEDHAPLTFVSLARGAAWLRPDAGDPVLLQVGDTAVLRGRDAYTVSDQRTRRVQVVIDEDQQCRAAPGVHENPMGPQGIRGWGNTPDGETVLLTGTYRTLAEVSRHLLAALPPLVVLPGAEWTDPLVGYLAHEAQRDEPGQDAVLDRLVDLLLIAALRAWFARTDAAPGWFRASSDAVVGGALALIHDDPAQPWTIGTLAVRAGTSRATLAKRFTELVGETPIGYLTAFRLMLAADLLAGTDLTLEAVARRVGYGSAFALSAAFKRERGVSPREHRRAATA